MALVLNEWSFCFAFRIYPVDPYGALYCEGPICRLGIPKQILLVRVIVIIFSARIAFADVIIYSGHIDRDSVSSTQWCNASNVPAFSQQVDPLEKVRRCRTNAETVCMLIFSAQRLIFAGLNFVLWMNVAGFGLFGRDHDNSEELMKVPIFLKPWFICSQQKI